MKHLFLLLLVITGYTAAAQSEQQKILNKFFETYAVDPEGAIDYIFGTNPYFKDAIEQIDNVKFKLQSAIKQIGKYYGYNLTSTRVVGENLAKYTYVVRYDREPLRFVLTLYKANDRWMVYNFKFDENLDEEYK